MRRAYGSNDYCTYCWDRMTRRQSSYSGEGRRQPRMLNCTHAHRWMTVDGVLTRRSRLRRLLVTSLSRYSYSSSIMTRPRMKNRGLSAKQISQRPLSVHQSHPCQSCNLMVYIPRKFCSLPWLSFKLKIVTLSIAYCFQAVFISVLILSLCCCCCCYRKPPGIVATYFTSNQTR